MGKTISNSELPKGSQPISSTNGDRSLKTPDRIFLPCPLLASFFGKVFSRELQFKRKPFYVEVIGFRFTFRGEDLRAT